MAFRCIRQTKTGFKAVKTAAKTINKITTTPSASFSEAVEDDVENMTELEIRIVRVTIDHLLNLLG
jgi:hypothetical protein